MPAVRFRDIPKVRLQVMIPEALAEEIRRRSYVETRAENAITTDMLCRGSGIDPATFGLGFSANPSPVNSPVIDAN
jgi:hypothetical protein